MRMDEWLEEMDRKEADLLERHMDEMKSDSVKEEEEVRFARQEQMALEKIYAEMNKETTDQIKGNRRHISRRAMFVLLAAAVLTIGTVAVAAENTGRWLDDFLGFSHKVDEKEDGFININKSVEHDGIRITAARSIGDKNCQWIELDTNILWTEINKYVGWNIDVSVFFDGKVEDESRSLTTTSREKDGYLTFIAYISEVDNINHANIKLKVKGLDSGKGKSNEVWKLSWTNNYEEKILTITPNKTIDVKDLDGTKYKTVIKKIEITPISVRICGEGEYTPLAKLESITLKDKTVLKVGNMTSSSVREEEKKYVAFYSLNSSGMTGNTFSKESQKRMDLDNIDYITIEGTKFDVN